MTRIFELLSLTALFAIGNTRELNVPDAKTCKIGQEWVHRFIKFYCYHKNTVGITKGVRAVGCVPQNDLSGTVISNGTTHTDDHFTYICLKTYHTDGSIYTYAATNCIDGENKALQPGQTRKLADGSTYKCYYDAENDVKLEVDGTGQGCNENGVFHAVRSAWLRAKNNEIEVKKGEKVKLGMGSAVACEKYENGTFYSREYGCVTIENKRIDPDHFGIVSNQHVVKCVRGKDGHLELELANEGVVSCQVEGKRIVAGEEWDSKDKTERYRCDYGNVVKIGCIVNKELIPVHEFRYINKIGYQCGEEMFSGFVNFGDLKGCHLKNGTVKQFFEEWETETELQLCRYRIDAGVVSSFVQQIACRYKKSNILLGAIAAVGKEVVKCELKDRSWVVRKLSNIEMEAWKALEFAHLTKKEVEAHEGEGRGEKMWTASTTTTTATTTKATTTKKTTTKKATTPTPAPLQECSDFLTKDLCAILAPICHHPENPLNELKIFVGNLKMDTAEQKKIKELVELLESEESHQSTSIPDTIDAFYGEFLTAGLNSGSSGKCCKTAASGCQQCRDRRAALRNVVQTTCPKTCNSCSKGSQIRDMMQSLVEVSKKLCKD